MICSSSRQILSRITISCEIGTYDCYYFGGLRYSLVNFKSALNHLTSCWWGRESKLRRGGGARNMKCRPPRSAAIFSMTIFSRTEGHGALPPPLPLPPISATVVHGLELKKKPFHDVALPSKFLWRFSYWYHCVTRWLPLFLLLWFSDAYLKSSNSALVKVREFVENQAR